MDLDQSEAFGEVDVSGGLDTILAAPEQWLVGRATDVRLPQGATAVVAVGMGGSGAAADVLAALAAEVLDVPLVVVKDGELPAFVGPRTPVLAVSYSGETEETLTATDQAIAAGAPVIAVASGGALASIVAAAGMPVVKVPEGCAPRQALGWLAAPLLAVCGLDAGIEEAVEAQRAVVAACHPDVPTAANEAKRRAAAIAACDQVICWGSGRLGKVAARRLVSQLHEHAKMPAAASEIPELVHNEVVGWEDAGGDPSSRGLVVMRDPAGESPAASARVGPARARVAPCFGWTAEVLAPDRQGSLARLAHLVMLADLTSVYAAIARDIDPTPTPSIDALKAATAATRRGEGA